MHREIESESFKKNRHPGVLDCFVPVPKSANRLALPKTLPCAPSRSATRKQKLGDSP